MKCLLKLSTEILLSSLILCITTLNINAQTTVTINATGVPGSFKTGAVNSAGTKLDGNMTTINSSTNRGWAVFDLSTIPAGAQVTAVNVIFTTFSSTLSTATNSIRGSLGNPASIAGNTLYTQLGAGTLINSSSWAANATITAAASAAGVAFVQTNIGSNVIISFVRGSTNTYNIYGYPGTSAQQPQLEITYLMPCTGTPTAGIVNGPSSICPSQNFTLSLTGSTVAGGITYQWQSRPTSGGSFTNITGATNSSLTTSITIPTDFQCVVKCTNSGLSANTPFKTITINSFYACYCKSGIGGSTSTSIDSVSIMQTTLNNASPGTAPGFYTQYPQSGNTTCNLQAGGLYTAYVKYSASAIGSAWLDVNKNGVFEATEWIQINTTGTTGVVTFQVPPNALLGVTGLRIRSASAGSTNGPTNPCTSFTTGETEDYIVTITPAPVNDIKMVGYITPTATEMCPFRTVQVRAVVYNNGSAPQSGFDITTYLSGPVSSTALYTYPGTLLPFKTDTITLTSYTFAVTGTYKLRSVSTLGSDVDVTNDSTADYTFKILPNANVPIVRNDSACFGQEAILYVLPDTFKHNWYNTPSYTTPIFTGDTLRIPNIQKDSFLYVASQSKALAGGSLTTINAPNNGCTAGAMFEIIPSKNLSIDSFASLFTATGSIPVNVYYRVGTYLGFENTPGAWTLLGSTTVSSTSTTVYQTINVGNRLNVIAGQTYGIYLNYDARYTNGTGTWSNADLTLNAGAGFCTAFTGAIAGRQFNGTVYYSTAASTCESPLLPINAYAGPKPIVNLGNDLTPCEDLDVLLDAGFTGGSYIWNTLQTTQYISVKNQSGTFWVEVDKYCKASDTININYQPLPSCGGISYLHNSGTEYIFSGSGIQNANSVLWIFGDGSTGSGYSTKHIYANNGSYKVLLVLTNDCGNDTTSLIIPLDVAKVGGKDDKIALYPNPATDKLTIDFGKNSTQLSGYEIISSIGNVVLKQNNINMTSEKMDIDISSLPAGNYIIKLVKQETTVSKPFVITR